MTDNDRELIEENRVLRAMCLKLIGVYVVDDQDWNPPERTMMSFRRRLDTERIELNEGIHWAQKNGLAAEIGRGMKDAVP